MGNGPLPESIFVRAIGIDATELRLDPDRRGWSGRHRQAPIELHLHIDRLTPGGVRLDFQVPAEFCLPPTWIVSRGRDGAGCVFEVKRPETSAVPVADTEKLFTN